MGVLLDARLSRRDLVLPGNARTRDRPPSSLRQLSNRWIGMLHGCLKTGITYDEHTTWAHILERAA
jgi:hypothetical protein